MNHAVCIVPVAPVRASNDHRAEMSSQLVFGESVFIHGQSNGWADIECVNDGYRGCCRVNQLKLQESPLTSLKIYTADWVQPLALNNEQLMLPLGSDLSILHANSPQLKIGYEGNAINAAAEAFDPRNIAKFAFPYLNTAYLWGGRTVFGIDCSGFAQVVFKMMDVSLPRDANQQVTVGGAVGFLEEAHCGDLAFFDDPDGKIVHVGILLTPSTIIHASGNVRIDKIDNQGIIHSQTNNRTHHIRTIRRMNEPVGLK